MNPAWKDKIGTKTLDKVKDNSEISAIRYHELLLEYWSEVGAPYLGNISQGDLFCQIYHREKFCDLLGQKGVKLNFAIKGRNQFYKPWEE